MSKRPQAQVAASVVQQDDGSKDVEIFLASVNLAKYVNTFLENGVDDLEIILELDDKHLEQMSIPLGHKLKIMKRIKDIRRDRGMSVLESRQGKEEPETTKYVNRRLTQPNKKDLEELPDPTNGIHTSGIVPLVNDAAESTT